MDSLFDVTNKNNESTILDNRTDSTDNLLNNNTIDTDRVLNSIQVQTSSQKSSNSSSKKYTKVTTKRNGKRPADQLSDIEKSPLDKESTISNKKKIV